MPEQILHSIEGQQLTLSLVSPDFIDSELLEAPETIYRYDDRGTRFYYQLGPKNLPTFGVSVTQIKDKVLGKPQGVIEKRIQMGDEAFFSYVKNRQEFGTFMHINLGTITRTGSFDLGDNGMGLKEAIDNYAEAGGVEYTTPRYGKLSWFDEAWLGMLSWVQFLEDYDVKPLAVELPLLHPDGFANTIDLVCEMNAKNYTKKTPKSKRKRINAIVDIKTGYIYADHAVQLAFNRRSMKHHYPKIKIKKVYNWTYKEWWSSPSYTLKDQTSSADVEEKLLDKYLDIYREKFYTKPSDIKLPTGKLAVGSDVTKNYYAMPIEQFIQQVKHNQNTPL